MNSMLRPVVPADLPVLAVLHAACFEDEAWDMAALSQLLAMPGTAGLLLEADDDPLGFALARTVLDEAELLTLCVLPAARRRGGGRILLDGVRAAVAAAGAAALFLEVAVDNAPAQALYTRSGFVEVGRRPNYYRRAGHAVDAVMMRVDLPAT